MKSLVVLLVLIVTPLLSEVAAFEVTIKVFNATRQLDERKDNFTLGTRVLLTCDVTDITEGSETLSYRWYHTCLGCSSRSEIRDGDPYYRVVSDTLLVDVISSDHEGRYYCTVHGLQETQNAATRNAFVAGDSAPFFYTPTSLLPGHSVLTDVQQATGRNGQQWITCRRGGHGTRPQIWMGSELVANSSTANSATIELGTEHPNGLYHCLSAQSQRHYFSLYLSNSVILPMPNVSVWNSSMWTLTSPDGSQVQRYIVEFDCRVQNIKFVEKYMSVNASGGTGRVATSVSCFGGLGQLYRMKVWAVSGPNISPALVCTTDGQCREKGTKPTTVIDTATPTTQSTGHTPPENTDKSHSTPSGPEITSTGEQPTVDTTFIGVGVGVGVFLLIVVCISVMLILVVVVIKRKAAYMQKRDTTVGDNPYYNNTAAVMQETEMNEQDAANAYQYARNYTGEEEDPFIDRFNPYEVDDRMVHSKTITTSASKETSTLASATNGPAVYAHEDVQYAMPIEKEGKLSEKGEAVVRSGGAEAARGTVRMMTQWGKAIGRQL